ncbi:MAG: type II toxin-antitoxin system RelE/ParE family toxin [Gammaproteobacteria bacterium]
MAKTFRVEITATAEADVAEIWAYIAHDNSEAASAFILRLEEKIGTLENFPERRPRVPESRLLGTRYRHLLFGHYRAIFKIAGDRVIVMRVLHGARLLDTKILEGLAP